MVPNRTVGSRVAYLLLAATVVVPVGSFAWGSRNDALAFVLYREPKLVAIVALGALLLLAIAGIDRGHVLTHSSLKAAIDRPVMLLLAFTGWAALSATWATVPANAHYELRQLAILVPLLIALVAWSRHDSRVPRRASWCLAVALAVATGAGGLQHLGALPFLVPINPLDQVAHPSVMGYKNPMALALVGQVFILAGLARTVRTAWARGAISALVVAEIIYLLTLQSRTAYVALAAGMVVTVGAEIVVRRRPRDRRPRAGAPTLAAAPPPRRKPAARRAARGIFLIGAASIGAILTTTFVSPQAWERIGSAALFVGDPAAYLDSDRGIYLRNTLHMVRERPLGVGLGDWQTQYPVFRAVERHRWFDATVQVRRAHSDHVQILGETGWLGLGLWLALWIAVLGRCARAVWRRDPWAAYVLAQGVALVVAMASDYLFELPYGKLNVFLVWFVALASSPKPSASEAPTREEPASKTPARGKEAAGTARQRRATFRVVAIVLTLHAITSCLYAWSLARSIHVSAALEERYAAWHRTSFLSAAAGADRPRIDAAGLAALATISAHGERLLRAPGHTKTRFRNHQQAAQAALLLGRNDLALAHTRRALSLHPYHPGLLGLMAAVQERRGSGQAAAWREAARYVMDQAVSGFERPYPRLDR